MVRTDEHAGVEFMAVDSGPGMADVAAAMRDGRSTAGTLGIGLGMIARLADTFDLHSEPGHGTVMLARFWPYDARSRHRGSIFDLPESVTGGVTRPISGGQECGDGWAARGNEAGRAAPGHPLLGVVPHPGSGAPDRPVPGGGILVMLCDGRGHGPLAKTASQTATRAFHASRGRSPEEVMKDIHQALPGTRGAAVAVARIEPGQQRVLFCGVGDTAAAIVTSTSKTILPSVPGTAGHQIRTLRTFTEALPARSALVMHSDGLTGQWDPAALTGVLQHSAAVIAGHLLRSAGKYHDDASVVVAKGLW